MASFTINYKGVDYTVLLDDDVWATWACQRQWRISTGGYVVSADRPQRALHRLVMGATDRRTFIDHKSGNRLDNRRENLRPATPKQNAQNNAPKRQYAGRQRVSQFKGVTWKRNRWRMQIKLSDGTRIDRLFADELEAAEEYNRLALEDQGEFARLNDTSGECPSDTFPAETEPMVGDPAPR